MIGTTEIIFIALIILLLFGGKKIPELMRGVGKGMRSFKQGMNGEEDSQINEENGTIENNGRTNSNLDKERLMNSKDGEK